MLGDAVSGSRRPSAVAVAAQIERVDVIAVAEFLSDPIPIASVVERAVDQNEGGLAVLTVIPELEFEAVGIEEVRDGFHFLAKAARESAKKPNTERAEARSAQRTGEYIEEPAALRTSGQAEGGRYKIVGVGTNELARA